MTETSENRPPSNDCRVCLVEHDDDIHAATLRVRAWYRGYVTRYFVEEEIEEEIEVLHEQCVA